MLLRVALDPDAGREFAESVRGPAPLLARRLQERWLLVADSRHALRKLVESFCDPRSVELNAVIAQLVAAGRFVEVEPGDGHAPVPIDEIDDAQLVATWRDFADLLLLANWRAEIVELEGALTIPEAVGVRDAFNTEAFARQEDAWNRTAVSGESRDRVWEETFAPFAKRASEAYINDKYLGKELDRALTTSPRSQSQRGAQWFLGRLAQTRLQHVHVATSAQEVRNAGNNPAEAKERIEAWFAGLAGRTRLDIHLVEGRFVHGRRLSFDGWAGFDLHKGVATFDEPTLTELLRLGPSRELADQIRKEFERLRR